MYQLFIGNKNYSSWSLRPWALLSELGIPFEERLVPFEPGSSPSFKRFSPSGRVPCLQDGPLAVWDSLAIVEYLAERHPGVWPADPAARAWARSAAAEMHAGFPALRSACSMSCGVRVQLASVSGALRLDLDRLDAIWADGLGRFGGPFLAGAAFTAVDAFYCPVAFRIQSYDLRLSERAKAFSWRLLALPSMRSWYEAALAEPFREPGHEEEIRLAGRLIVDLRAPST
jgi:glutathione S-transferase